MLPLTLGLLLFFAAHLVPTSPSLRQGLADRFGETAYKIGFSVISLIAFALIVAGYHKLQMMPGKNPVLWDPPSWTRHIAFLLMLPAMILIVAAFVPSRIRTAAKHPMLAAIKAWALSHLLVNGDLGSLVLFGSFLAFAVYDRISIKRRPATVQSGPPPPAINDVLVIVGGLALYAVMMFWGHGALIGVPIVGFDSSAGVLGVVALIGVAALAALASPHLEWRGAIVVVVGLGLGAATLGLIQKIELFGVSCYVVGSPTAQSDCLNPLVYYALLAFALLLVIAGTVHLLRTNQKPM